MPPRFNKGRLEKFCLFITKKGMGGKAKKKSKPVADSDDNNYEVGHFEPEHGLG